MMPLAKLRRGGLRNLGVASSICALLLALSACSQVNADSSGNATVALTKTLRIPSPLASEGIENQYSQLAWHPVTHELAANTMSGPWVFIVNPETGAHQTLRVRERGSEFRLAWLPKSRVLAASSFPYWNWVQWHFDGGKVERTDRQGLVKIDILNPRAYQALTVPSMGEVFLMAGDSVEPIGDDHARLALYSPDSPKPKQVWEFPDDGTYYHTGQSAAGMREGELIVALQVHRVIKPGTRTELAISEDDVWLVNLTQGKVQCRLDALEKRRDPVGNKGWQFEALSLTPDGSSLAVNSSGAFDIYDTKSCRRTHRLIDYYRDRSGSRSLLEFTSNGRYLIGAGGDVRVKEGGWLEVWRVSDWTRIRMGPEQSTWSLAVHPTRSEFALGRVGRIDLYTISEK
ncbi:hypothetical protein [Cupriavidus taiwanensis]|uniref:hypothetical protein n=1 Tax=Cupriavidus taiwanensis TaxID=164546 RepID=UPI000E118261|nr:hypothetical protein [Cupriavidus taiwanensis]SOY59688.1 exported hypothetical protein [Cupriavidus taiwanensis]